MTKLPLEKHPFSRICEADESEGGGLRLDAVCRLKSSARFMLIKDTIIAYKLEKHIMKLKFLI
jgi:hypothetical protein